MLDRLHRFVRPLFALALPLLAVAGAGCTTHPTPSTPTDATPRQAADDAVRFIVLQLNDVYEIAPISGGKAGGLARVATVRKELLEEDADVFTVLAGDFLSPSAMGTARVEGSRLDGRQMVATLNALGLDWAAYGNHEMDLNEASLRARLRQAEFPMVSANVTAADGSPMPNTVESVVFTAGRDDPRSIRVGLTGVVLTENEPPYVRIADPLPTLKKAVEGLEDHVDVVLALTHLNLDDDIRAVEDIPGIDMSLGGHEHVNWQAWRGRDLTPIFKADANARTVYVHRVRVTGDGEVHVTSELLPIDASIEEDEATAKVVKEWTDIAFAAFRKDGFEPEETVTVTGETLDGRESSVRFGPTTLTRLIADALAAAAGVDVALYNSGAIRIDDEIPPGPVTQYDVIRVLPYGGAVKTVKIRGALLRKALDQSLSLRGEGGFLQTTANVTQGPDGTWTLGGRAINPDATYTVAMDDYVAAGRQSGLEFLAPPAIVVTGGPRGGADIRRAVITELRKRYPATASEPSDTAPATAGSGTGGNGSGE